MPYIDLPDPVIVDNRNKADSILKKYKEAEILQDHWKPKYEEAYEYTLPQRQSFYEEAKKSYVIVTTTDARPFGCFIITKGVIKPDGSVWVLEK